MIPADLAGRGYDGAWFERAGRDLARTVLAIRARLLAHDLWRHVAREVRSEVGRLVFAAADPDLLRADLARRRGFTGPRGTRSAWRSREKRPSACLHFKHFAGWEDDLVEVHLDPIGPWGDPWRPWRLPLRLWRHWRDPDGWGDLDRVLAADPELERLAGWRYDPLEVHVTDRPSKTRDLPALAEWDEPSTTLQSIEIVQVDGVLSRWFAADPDVVVARELSIRYDLTDRRQAVQPDVFVARGVPRRLRDEYLPWKEDRAPVWVLEIASGSTAHRDRAEKPLSYHDLGVREVFLFDPEWMHHERILKGLRWTPEGFEEIPAEGDAIPSAELGLVLVPEPYVLEKVRSWRLRFRDPATGEFLPATGEILASQAATRYLIRLGEA